MSQLQFALKKEAVGFDFKVQSKLILKSILFCLCPCFDPSICFVCLGFSAPGCARFWTVEARLNLGSMSCREASRWGWAHGPPCPGRRKVHRRCTRGSTHLSSWVQFYCQYLDLQSGLLWIKGKQIFKGGQAVFVNLFDLKQRRYAFLIIEMTWFLARCEKIHSLSHHVFG